MTKQPITQSSGGVRHALSVFLILVLALVWSHALAAVLRAATDLNVLDFAPASIGLTLGGLATGVTGCLTRASRGSTAVRVGLVGFVAALTIGWMNPGAFVPALSLIPAGLGAVFGVRFLDRRWTSDLVDGHIVDRKVAVLFCAVAGLAILQFGRLSTYMTDPGSDWHLTTRDPFFAKHECANAYVLAAELNERGESNVYGAEHYPGINPDAAPSTRMVGMVPEDPYQYPPQFLLLPRLAIALTNDYGVIRSCWFALNVTLCLASVLALGRWVGGRTGRTAVLLTPALMASFPVLNNFQYGQFHFAAIAFAILGLLAFERERVRIGGALLAGAILAKVFPAIVLIPLAAQKRWRELGWTVAAVSAATLVSIFVVGTAPFSAFFAYHLPRLADGSAFAFGEAWPEVSSLLIAGNQGIAGILDKLVALGVMVESASVFKAVSLLYGLFLVLLSLSVAQGLRDSTRAQHARSWLGLLGLASLASAGAWADYVPLTCVWVLALLVPLARKSRLAQVALALGAFMQWTLAGSMPLGSESSPDWMIPVSLAGAISMLALFVIAAVPHRKQRVIGAVQRRSSGVQPGYATTVILRPGSNPASS